MTTLPLAPTTDLAIRTHCPYCAYQCGMLIGDGASDAPASIQGDPHFPVNNGQLCIKGWTSTALLRHPERITTPLVRSGGDLRPATWEAALDEVDEALLTGESDSVPRHVGDRLLSASFCVAGEGVYRAVAVGKESFAQQTSADARRYRFAPSPMQRLLDTLIRALTAITIGLCLLYVGLYWLRDFPQADLWRMLVGSNAADTLPPIVQWFERQKRAGGRLAVIDPRKTATAKAADLFLPVTPGSDLALANGLLYLALEENLVNVKFIGARTTGFEAVRRTVLTYHPAHVERLTGVGEAAMRKLVRWLGTARSAMILSGRGAEQHSKGVDTVQAFINLALALGLPGRPASGWGCLTGQGNGQGGREHGQKADQLPGYRLIENEAHRAAIAKVWDVDPASLPPKGKSAFELLDSLGPDGGIRSLLKENRVHFHSDREAMAAGYRPCQDCRPAVAACI